MRWKREELLQNENITFEENPIIDDSAFAGNTRINGVKDLRISGTGWLNDDENRFYCRLKVSGIMLCPDAISNEEIEYPFETESDEVYVFGDPQDDSERRAEEDAVDLTRAVIDDILLETPLQVTELSEDEYPEGDGWKVYSEEEYQRSQKDRMDPRLAGLKNYRNEE